MSPDLFLGGGSLWLLFMAVAVSARALPLGQRPATPVWPKWSPGGPSTDPAGCWVDGWTQRPPSLSPTHSHSHFFFGPVLEPRREPVSGCLCHVTEQVQRALGSGPGLQFWKDVAGFLLSGQCSQEGVIEGVGLGQDSYSPGLSLRP